MFDWFVSKREEKRERREASSSTSFALSHSFSLSYNELTVPFAPSSVGHGESCSLSG